jgi:preprotein translocase subunit Sec63
VLRGVGSEGESDGHASEAQVAAIDAEGVRERVRARRQLVEDGDYFALLGVSHDATGYEVRRAFLELRRAFDPSRVLTPEVADLAEDVKQITMVLEEAYDILKDSARRERYRRAIEAVPGG